MVYEGLMSEIEAQRVVEGNSQPEATPVTIESLRINLDELETARISPTCIVKNYLYADFGTLAAPGGTGKTTLVLNEMINIALGRPVHGLEVKKLGMSLLITSEDRREQCAARLREMMHAMDLKEAEMQKVLDNLLIWDVTGEPLRLVTNINGNIIPTNLADTIVKLFRDQQPSVITFDPSVSFGACEGMVNDNEQAIVTACRRIVRELDCCVRMVAHTGKMNARQGTLDQYSSRGGSALSDGARMVAVLQPWKAEDRERIPPVECHVDNDSSLTILARPKLSYAPANLPYIWIKRTGWNYEAFTEIRQSPEELQNALFDQIILFLGSEVKAGTRHNKTSLELAIPNVKRNNARSAINLLIAMGRIEEIDLPANEQRTRRKTYLAPAGFGSIQKKDPEDHGGIPALNNAATYRKNNGGINSRSIIPQVSNSAATSRQDSAVLAGLKDKDHVPVS